MSNFFMGIHKCIEFTAKITCRGLCDYVFLLFMLEKCTPNQSPQRVQNSGQIQTRTENYPLHTLYCIHYIAFITLHTLHYIHYIEYITLHTIHYIHYIPYIYFEVSRHRPTTIEPELTKDANFNPEFFLTSQEFEILHTGFFRPN